MAFDEKKFMNTKFTPREREVKVPDMKDFFEPKEPPVFRVRGLTGNELATVHEAVEKHKNIAALIEGLLSKGTEEKIEAIRNALGVSSDVPGEIARRLEMITIGAVQPVITLEIAVKFCEVYPIEFYEVTTAISELTGRGQVPGKPKPSGETTKCAQ